MSLLKTTTRSIFSLHIMLCSSAKRARQFRIYFKFSSQGLGSSFTRFNRPLSNYASVPANNNLKSRLRARKYRKCMKTWHKASTSGYCSRELKSNWKVVYYRYFINPLSRVVFFHPSLFGEGGGGVVSIPLFNLANFILSIDLKRCMHRANLVIVLNRTLENEFRG